MCIASLFLLQDPAAVELSKTYNAAGSYRATDFSNFAEELRTSPHYENLQQRDADSMFSFSDVVAYKLENAIAANPAVRFHILLLISALACAILSGLWTMAHQGEDDTTADWWSAVFMTFQASSSSAPPAFTPLVPSPLPPPPLSPQLAPAAFSWGPSPGELGRASDEFSTSS